MTSEKGFALILALVVTTLVATAALDLTRESRLSSELAGNFRDYTLAKMQARDGLERAVVALIEDDPIIDGPADGWAMLAAETEAEAKETDKPIYIVQVVDLAGRFDINRLSSEKSESGQVYYDIMDRLLDSMNVDPEVLVPVLDWLDSDDLLRPGGAERGDYNEFGADATPRNGYILDIKELALIKGMNAKLLTGTDDQVGLYELLTVFGQEKININTASRPLLEALSIDMNANIVEEIMDLRQRGENLDMADFRALGGITPELLQQLDKLIGIASTRFLINSEGRAGKAKFQLSAVVERSEGTIRVLAGGVAP